MDDDAELLRRYAEENSEDAFAELVRRHVDFVYTAALRQARNPHRAEDVTQRVFTDLARKAGALARRSEIVGWLHTSTHYAAVSVVRSEARRTRREQQASLMQETTFTPEPEIDGEKLREVLDAALHDLPERDRTAILLRFFKPHSMAEIGAALAISEDAARKCVDRALGKLEDTLVRRGVTSTSAALALAMGQQAALAAPAGFAAALTTTILSELALGGGAACTAVAGWWQLASAGKLALGVGMLAGAFAVGWGCAKFREARATEATATMTAQRIASLRTDATRLRQSANADQMARAAVGRRTAAAVASASPQIMAATRESVPGPRSTARTEHIQRDPGVQQALAELMRGIANERLGSLYRSLRLSSQEAERLETVFRRGARFTESDHDIDCAIVLSPLSEFTADQLGEIAEVLGDARYGEFSAYQRSFVARAQIVETLAANLLYSETPLQLAQGEQLLRILTTWSPEYRVGGDLNLVTLEWSKAFADARGVLTPAQFAALQRLSGQISSTWAMVNREAEVRDPSSAPIGEGRAK